MDLLEVSFARPGKADGFEGATGALASGGRTPGDMMMSLFMIMMPAPSQIPNSGLPAGLHVFQRLKTSRGIP